MVVKYILAGEEGDPFSGFTAGRVAAGGPPSGGTAGFVGGMTGVASWQAERKNSHIKKYPEQRLFIPSHPFPGSK
jgi:hypothetical protein